MIDHRLALLLLARLEQATEGISTADLHTAAFDAGFSDPDIRRIQRYLNLFQKRGIGLTRNKRLSKLNPNCDRRDLFHFIKEILHSVSYNKILFGDFSAVEASLYFESHPAPVSLLHTIVEACLSHQLLVFDYTPQTELTREKMKLRALFAPTRKDTIPVTLLPRFFIASKASFMVLGEFFPKQSFNKIVLENPRDRQYELRGIANLQVGEVHKPTLDIDPRVRYRNSVNVWVGGTEYSITLEEMDTVGKIACRRQKKVNGEEEILSYVAASLGKIKIVDPPQEIVQRAAQIGLPTELVFRFTQASDKSN